MSENPAYCRKVPISLNKSGALARRTAGATLLPLCALPYRSIARARNPITVTLSPSSVRASWTAARAREGCSFLSCRSLGRSHRGSEPMGLGDLPSMHA